MKSESLKKLNDILYVTSASNFGESADYVAKLVMEVIRMETPAASTKFDIAKFCDTKDSIRPAMQSVFHDQGYKVASDGQILIALKEQYADDMEQKLLNVHTGEIYGHGVGENKQRYPKWRDVIPNHNHATATISLDKLNEAMKAYRSAKKAAVNELEYNFVCVNVTMQDGIEKPVYFYVDKLHKFSAFLKEKSITTLSFDIAMPGCRAVLAQAEDGSIGIVMPRAEPNIKDHIAVINA